MLSEIDICKAMKMLEKIKNVTPIMSATNFTFPIQRAVMKIMRFCRNVLSK